MLDSCSLWFCVLNYCSGQQLTAACIWCVSVFVWPVYFWTVSSSVLPQMHCSALPAENTLILSLSAFRRCSNFGGKNVQISKVSGLSRRVPLNIHPNPNVDLNYLWF